MGNTLKVKFWADAANKPEGVPDNDVAEIVHIGASEHVDSPWMRITEEDFLGWTQGRSALRDELRAYIRQRAYELEIEGMELNGAQLSTGRDDQAMLSGAVNFMSLNPDATIDWQGADGAFVTLNKAQVEGIASAVGTHVQAHFTRRKELSEALDVTHDRDLEQFRNAITDFWED